MNNIHISIYLYYFFKNETERNLEKKTRNHLR